MHFNGHKSRNAPQTEFFLKRHFRYNVPEKFKEKNLKVTHLPDIHRKTKRKTSCHNKISVLV